MVATVVHTFAELETAITKAANRMGSTQDLMEELGEYLLLKTKDRVRDGIQPDGQPFAPRSQTTLDQYAKRGASYGNVLNQTGDMRDGISYEAGDGRLELGSNAIQAAVMQFGAAQGEFGASIGKDKLGRDHFHHTPWGDIPARPFLGISAEDETEMLTIVAEWLESTTDIDLDI